MADIMRWRPAEDILSLRRAMDRLFESAFVGRDFWGGPEGAAGPELDLYEQDDDLVVTAALPGVKPEDVEVTVRGNVLTIQGETRSETEGPSGRYHRRERRSGSFLRHIQLPAAVDADKARASFEHGLLRLRLPKAEEARQRRIPVQAGAPRPGEIGRGEEASQKIGDNGGRKVEVGAGGGASRGK
jgi:HSP20 family protein